MHIHRAIAGPGITSNTRDTHTRSSTASKLIHASGNATAMLSRTHISGRRRIAGCFALWLLAAAMPLTAATEFEDSVPIELARIFLGVTGVGGATLYQDIMDEFPPFTVPDALEVLGSIDQIYSQRVVLRTDLDQDAAKAAITEAFTVSGWQEIDFNTFRPGQQGGFVSTTQPELPTQICHDSHGMMQVSISASPAGQLVNLSRSPAAMAGGFGRLSPCDPARFGPADMMGPGGRSGVIAHMPTLVVPEAPASRNRLMGVFSGGSGGNQNDYEARTPLSTELALAELYAHFATQIIQQGWVADNESTGNFLATGSFTKTVEGDVELIGILNVLEVGDDAFDLKFRILAKGGGNATGGVRVMNAPALGIQGRAP